MDFEYRRPDVEAALEEARTVDQLEAAFRASIELMGDLSKPEVYGRTLFTRGLDAAVVNVARRLGLVDRPNGKSNENVCILATRLYESGGHSKVASDISELIGGDKTTVVLTDVYGKLRHKHLLATLGIPVALQRRADVLLSAPTLVEKALELYQLLAALRPTRIFMLTHHFDIVAAVALWPFRDVVEFLHHADTVPAIGATLPFSAHVDLTWRCHHACEAVGLSPFYAGMTVRSGNARPTPRMVGAAGRLRIATCGPEMKYEGAMSDRWIDYVRAALADATTEFVHIGPTSEPFRNAIAGALSEANLDPQRYVFTGSTPDLAAELVRQEADIYLSSYPLAGGKATLEAMAIGLPAIVPVDAQSSPIQQFDFPAPTWIRVNAPAEMAEALGRAKLMRQAFLDGPGRTAIDAELARFEDRTFALDTRAPLRTPEALTPEGRVARSTANHATSVRAGGTEALSPTESTNQAYRDILNSVVPEKLQGAEAGLAKHLRASPIPDQELAENAPLFQTVRSLKRQLYLNELYQQILPVHGVVMQFGVRWGRDIASFDAFRTIYEPFNISRQVIGFDTFEGFPSVHEKDGSHGMMVEHGLALTEGYLDELTRLLDARRGLDPLPHLERCSLVQGDVTATLPAYLAAHPETIVAFAHFDLDLYAPTKACLEALKPYLTRGSILAFDELVSPLSPGETEALREVFGLDRFRIQRSPRHSGQGSYFVVD